MDERLLVLRLVLDELSVPLDASSIESRKVMQKAVYLAQAAGVPLGYRFNWYVKGPYSPGLTEDYYKTATEGGDMAGRALRDELRARLRALKPLLEPNGAENLTRADWLELLASWHYLRASRRLTQEDAQQTMHESKPRLAPKGLVAEGVLATGGLLPAGIE